MKDTHTSKSSNQSSNQSKNQSKNQSYVIAAQSLALRRLANLLEAVASLIEISSDEAPVATPTVQLEPLVPTRKMPSMEAQARALDEAVRAAVPEPVPE